MIVTAVAAAARPPTPQPPIPRRAAEAWVLDGAEPGPSRAERAAVQAARAAEQAARAAVALQLVVPREELSRECDPLAGLMVPSPRERPRSAGPEPHRQHMTPDDAWLVDFTAESLAARPPSAPPRSNARRSNNLRRVLKQKGLEIGCAAASAQRGRRRERHGSACMEVRRRCAGVRAPTPAPQDGQGGQDAESGDGNGQAAASKLAVQLLAERRAALVRKHKKEKPGPAGFGARRGGSGASPRQALAMRRVHLIRTERLEAREMPSAGAVAETRPDPFARAEAAQVSRQKVISAAVQEAAAEGASALWQRATAEAVRIVRATHSLPPLLDKALSLNKWIVRDRLGIAGSG